MCRLSAGNRIITKSKFSQHGMVRNEDGAKEGEKHTERILVGIIGIYPVQRDSGYTDTVIVWIQKMDNIYKME